MTKTIINAKIVADSKNQFEDRITTMVVTFPRIILAEFNTHRMFSRNSASSRAIPFEKMLKAIEEDPFIPIAWQKDHKGMQGTEYITDEKSVNILNKRWIKASKNVIKEANNLKSPHTLTTGKQIPLDITKQLCNRMLEPYMWTTVIVTATEWENFFALRCPKYEWLDSKSGQIKSARSRKDVGTITGSYTGGLSELQWLQMNKGQAEIHMMALAEAMWDEFSQSIPKELKEGEWHIPFEGNFSDEQIKSDVGYEMDGSDASEQEFNNKVEEIKIKIAIARCARVSYTTVGEKKYSDYKNDIILYDKLFKDHHGSPLEHCARAMSENEYLCCSHTFYNPEKDSDHDIERGCADNFKGFIQQRRLANYK